MKSKSVFIFLFGLFLFSSCDNSLNLLTDWEEKTVVYAILDCKDSISYIKLQKHFWVIMQDLLRV